MIRTRDEVNDVCAKHGIPEHMWDTVERYLFDHLDGVSFFTAVVENNLVKAARTADHMNRAALHNWALLLYNDFPSDAWGNRYIVSAWLKASKDKQ